MNKTPEPTDDASAKALREYARLQKLIEQARVALGRVQQDVAEAESQLGRTQASQLIEVNEQLVLSMLRAQNEAQTAAQALSEVSKSAELDALTGLPNRVVLLDRFAQASANARRRRTRMALLFLDLDDFKQINDGLGHAVGDEVTSSSPGASRHRCARRIRSAAMAATSSWSCSARCPRRAMRSPSPTR